MKTIFTTIFFLLSASALAAAAPSNLNVMDSVMRSIQEEVKAKGCNANICFALDGSGSVESGQFALAKAFVQDVINTFIFANDNQYSAVQYGTVAYLVTRLIPNRAQFNKIIERVSFRGDPVTSIGSGIVACHKILSRHPEDANKMVIISDGRNNFGGQPVRNANIFRSQVPTGRISTVAIGEKLDEETLKAIAGESGTLFTTANYTQLSNRVEDLVRDVCDF